MSGMRNVVFDVIGMALMKEGMKDEGILSVAGTSRTVSMD